MSYAVKFHAFIARTNLLIQLTQNITKFLLEHPTIYKIALLVNHLFRAISMAFFLYALPCSFPVSLALCFGASLFYRLTVENNCAYKFALPAFGGGVALPIAHSALVQLASGSAFKSLALFSQSLLSLVPFSAYITYILLTVDYDVMEKNGFIR